MSYNSLMGLASHSADANLLAHWPLQETTGTQATDDSGNARHGTITGMGANPTTTTGPNSYLTSAYAFDDTDDYVDCPTTAGVTGAGARTLGGWVYADNQNQANIFASFGFGASGRAFEAVPDTLNVLKIGGGSLATSTSPGIPTTTWTFVTYHVPPTPTDTDDILVYVNGSLLPDLLTSTARTVQTTIAACYLGAGNELNYFFAGDMAGWFSFDRSLSLAEVGELYAGPEPENTVAPTVSGDTAQGSTLTVSPGTWALPSPFSGGSNGTVTYTYQWTRDGGNISGATSSTYVTQVADVGTAVGCKVLGANDGGSDSAEQTASSNTISVVSSGTTYRMNMRLFIPTQV